ncbi:MAG: CRISPR-associated protein, partial [Caldisericia bacterium]
MLLNLSNHPKDKWQSKQLETALKKYKSIVDLPFPSINPKANSYQVKKKAETYLKKCLSILAKSSDKFNAVHLMGEFTFV